MSEPECIGTAESVVGDKSVKQIKTTRVSSLDREVSTEQLLDTVSVEEPLEIRVSHKDARTTSTATGNTSTDSMPQQIAVTMRTPGCDKELAVGFLFTEGIISGESDIADIILDKRCNGVTVHLREHVVLDPAVFSRHSFVASSCGICGKKSIAAVRVKRQFECLHDQPQISYGLIHQLPALQRAQQSEFERTGGIHASCLFDVSGNLLAIKEDVGRHNALDKLLGAELLAGRLPLKDSILMLSGRASFELVQKAAHAGLAVVAAVGAPSSLAVQLAEECDMTLLGFVRDGRFNIYSGSHRIQLDSV
ncbi:MAG TPA: formate dehydrogenase accessory sulfurtransferase FdhD [Drouetiella sp.]|jgi:FdhD protein